MTTKRLVELKSSTDDLMLRANLYIPETIIGVVQIIHGMAEHKERYEHLAAVLTKANFVVLIADNRGHGASTNENIPYGYFADENGWLVNLQDMHLFSEYLMERYRNLPFFVIGHSMGSLIAHSYLKRYEDCLSGVIFSGMPAYNSATPTALKLAKFLAKSKGAKKYSNILNNGTNFNKDIRGARTEFDWLSYNCENVDKYIADEQCGFPFTIGGYRDLFEGMLDVYKRKDWRVLKKQLPILFVVGQDDPCADVTVGFKNALNNLSQVGYEKIEANIYENMRHEIFNENDKMVVYLDIIKWLTLKVKAHYSAK